MLHCLYINIFKKTPHTVSFEVGLTELNVAVCSNTRAPKSKKWNFRTQ